MWVVRCESDETVTDCNSSDSLSREVKIASLCDFARHAGVNTHFFAFCVQRFEMQPSDFGTGLLMIFFKCVILSLNVCLEIVTTQLHRTESTMASASGFAFGKQKMTKNKGLSFYKKKKTISSATVKEVFSWFFGIVAAIFIAAVLNYFMGMTTEVVGVSMEPTLYNGQKVYINRFLYILSSPKAGDVVVFLPNGNENAHYYIKRVVAVPGDQLVVKDGVLYVNGLESTWVTEKLVEAGIAENEYTLKNGEYFCIGDNPGNSEDSRSANIGPVEETDIVGRVWFRGSCQEQGMGFVK